MAAAGEFQRTILCLANSRRPGGRCVAGKVWADNVAGAWIRPINPANGNANSMRDIKYENGTPSDVLDIIRIRMTGQAPNGHQTENENINPGVWWTRVGRADWNDVTAATDNIAGPIFGPAQNSYHGRSDKILAGAAAQLHRSLALIKPQNLKLIVDDESMYGGGYQRRVRADFSYNNIHYNVVVTDPLFEAEYRGKDDGEYP